MVGMLSYFIPPLPSGAIAYWNAADYDGSSIPSRVVGASSLTISGGTVSGGYINHGTYSATATFNSAQNASAYTLMYLAKHSGTPNPSFENIFASYGVNPAYENLSVGPLPTFTGGTLYNNTQIEQTPDGLNANRVDWWGGLSQGPFIGAHRYDGATASSFLNGVKLTNTAITVAAPAAFTAVEVGAIQNSAQHTTYDIACVIYWPRALSDAEILQAYHVLNRQGITLTTPRTVVSIGDSITFGVNTTASYSYLMIPNLSPQAFGANYGHSGIGLNNWIGWASALDTIPASIGVSAPYQECILTILLGANDLTGTDGTTYSTNLAAFCDARRAAGWKVVLCTILARNDGSDGGTLFNSRRAVVNTNIRGWVGTHIDAVADFAADATMGTDSAPNVGTSLGSSASSISLPNPAIQTGGTGYTNGTQTLTLVGGTFTTAATISVTVSGGVVTAVNSVTNAGAYSVPPVSPVATSGGGGTGCTINATWLGTYFSAQLHPTDAGHALLEPICRAAVNSL